MTDITCSIVLYNNHPDEIKITAGCFLGSNLQVKLFLIDNSPTDKLRSCVSHPNCEYIFNGKNVGYGAGHNIAIRQSILTSTYYLVLNPDIRFNPEVLEGLFAFMNDNPDVGLSMPKVRYETGELQYLCKKLPTPIDLFARRFIPALLKNTFKKVLDEYELKHKNYHSIMQVPNLSGCFMFIKTKLFPIAGMFDEQYFLYLEDTDLSRRINEYSLTVYYPYETIVHGYQKASYKNFKLLTYHLSSSIKYFNKWGWFKDRMRDVVNTYLELDDSRFAGYTPPAIQVRSKTYTETEETRVEKMYA